jgi:hypothetical protein
MKHFIDSIQHPQGIWKNISPLELRKSKKPFLLYFWRSHTPESVETLHELDNFFKRYSAKVFPFTLLTIHGPEFHPHDDPWEQIVAGLGIDLPVLHDPHFSVWEDFHVQHAPSFLLIDSFGNELVRRAGNFSNSGISSLVASEKYNLA